MGRGGTPPRKLTDNEIEQLRLLSMIRVPMEHIAALFKLSKDTLERAIKKDPAARAALAEGRGQASSNVRGTLYQLAVGLKDPKDPTGNTWLKPPDLSALRFWCETQEGFKREERLELYGNLDITAMNSDERRKMIDKLISLRQLGYEEEQEDIEI